MPVQPPKRPVIVAPKKPIITPKPQPKVPGRSPVSQPVRQPVRRDLPMAAPMQGGGPMASGGSPLMDAMSPQAANTRPMIGQVAPGSMFGAGRQQAPQSNPSQFTRVSPGVYRGPNGQIVNSAMNPGNQTQRPQMRPPMPLPRGQMPGMNQPVGIGQFEQGQMQNQMQGPPNGMNAFNGAGVPPGGYGVQQPQTGGGLQLAPGMQQPGSAQIPSWGAPIQGQMQGQPQLAVDNNLPVQGGGASLPRINY